ncbi:hypothetical protein M2273_004084 [Mucilaginibacter lappiensis]|jgi:hypothetical protein
MLCTAALLGGVLIGEQGHVNKIAIELQFYSPESFGGLKYKTIHEK